MVDATKQLKSWSSKHGAKGHPHLVGQVFFPYNGTNLDTQDKTVLDDLVKGMHHVMMRDSMVLRIQGHTDYRGPERANRRIGRKRAKSVKQYLDAKLGRYQLYSSSCESKGEEFASRDRPDGDRRVDIFSSVRVDRPPIVVPPVKITAKYIGPLSKEFQFRTLAGGGRGGFGPTAQSVGFEIKNSRTGQVAGYTYAGFGWGIIAGVTRLSGWEKQTVPIWMDVQDFAGSGIITSAGVGRTGTLLTFSGPRDRGMTNKDIDLTFAGWEFQAGVQADVMGWWHCLG